MEKYRIVKKSDRKDETAEIISWYIIEKLCEHRFLWMKWSSWNKLQITRHYGIDVYSVPLVFGTEGSAREHVLRLLVPVPDIQIIEIEKDAGLIP